MDSATAPTKATFADRLRDIPAWASTLIVLLVLGGAGWFLWSQIVSGPPMGEEIDVGVVNTGRRGNFLPRQQAAPVKEGVALLGAGLFRVKSGDFSMNLSAKNADFRVFYDKGDLLPREQVQVLQARRDVSANPARVKQLNMTPEQLKKLQAIPAGVGSGMKITDADRAKLKALWDAYNAAGDGAKPAKEVELVTALNVIGQSALAPTRAQYAERVEQIKSVFTADQLKQLIR